MYKNVKKKMIEKEIKQTYSKTTVNIENLLLEIIFISIEYLPLSDATRVGESGWWVCSSTPFLQTAINIIVIVSSI